jgi:hypothetical protein
MTAASERDVGPVNVLVDKIRSSRIGGHYKKNLPTT